MSRNSYGSLVVTYIEEDRVGGKKLRREVIHTVEANGICRVVDRKGVVVTAGRYTYFLGTEQLNLRTDDRRSVESFPPNNVVYVYNSDLEYLGHVAITPDGENRVVSCAADSSLLVGSISSLATNAANRFGDRLEGIPHLMETDLGIRELIALKTEEATECPLYAIIT